MRHKEQSTEMNTDKEFLRTEPLRRLLLKLALPTDGGSADQYAV